MTRIVIRELVFDSYNLEHIKKHSVTRQEIESVAKEFIYHRRTHSGRYLTIGKTKKRIITIVVKRESSGRYYLITARDASKKERGRAYEKEK